jgi:predicted AlkP superfamily pyrophosphatase or phosphodiesterase
MLQRIITTVFFTALSLYLNAQRKDSPYVILISFDGFRSDYVQKIKLPHFEDFIRNGASAEGLIPSFPAKTIPNHYTLITGLYPGHHGVVDNQFFDPIRKSHFGMRIREAVTDPYYYGGVPLWQLCKQNGIRSASYFWVGSEVNDESIHPDLFFPYDQSVPFGNRIEQVISWLQLPENERPHFISLYFSSPDNESHAYGPFAAETIRSVQNIDSLLGNFLEQVKRTKLPVNLVIVSDHGMSELRHQPETYLFIDELVAPGSKGITAVNGGTQVHLYTDSQQRHDSLKLALSAYSEKLTILEQDEFPERWHYKNDRSGDLLMVVKPGHVIVSGSQTKTMESKKPNALFGVHGYDAFKVKEMLGIFYAQGPAIKAGSKVPAFENVHVYPFIAKILGLQPPVTDGKSIVLDSITKD